MNKQSYGGYYTILGSEQSGSNRQDSANVTVPLSANAKVQLDSLSAGNSSTTRQELVLKALEFGLSYLAFKARPLDIDVSVKPDGITKRVWDALSSSDKTAFATAKAEETWNRNIIGQLVELRQVMSRTTEFTFGSVEHIAYMNAVRDDAALCRQIAREEAQVIKQRGLQRIKKRACKGGAK